MSNVRKCVSFVFYSEVSPVAWNSFAGVLEDVSSRGDTESRSGLAEVVSEVSLALARRSTDWVASASELEHFSNRNAERAEATFSQYSVQLRTKVRRGPSSARREGRLSKGLCLACPWVLRRYRKEEDRLGGGGGGGGLALEKRRRC